MKELGNVRDALKRDGLEVLEADLQYVPNDVMNVSDPGVAKKIIKIMDALDDLDDITNTYSNFDIDEAAIG